MWRFCTAKRATGLNKKARVSAHSCGIESANDVSIHNHTLTGSIRDCCGEIPGETGRGSCRDLADYGEKIYCLVVVLNHV